MSDLVPRIKATLQASADEHAALFVGTDADRTRYRERLASFEGCTEPELKQLETQLGYRLPNVFRTFLEHFGRNCSNLFDGSTLETIDRYISLRDLARRLVAEIGQPDLIPENAVVFLHHQGYDFAFFAPSNDVDDPPVYWCNEGGDKHRAANSISEFLASYTRSTVDNA